MIQNVMIIDIQSFMKKIKKIAHFEKFNKFMIIQFNSILHVCH